MFIKVFVLCLCLFLWERLRKLLCLRAPPVKEYHYTHVMFHENFMSEKETEKCLHCQENCSVRETETHCFIYREWVPTDLGLRDIENIQKNAHSTTNRWVRDREPTVMTHTPHTPHTQKHHAKKEHTPSSHEIYTTSTAWDYMSHTRNVCCHYEINKKWERWDERWDKMADDEHDDDPLWFRKGYAYTQPFRSPASSACHAVPAHWTCTAAAQAYAGMLLHTDHAGQKVWWQRQRWKTESSSIHPSILSGSIHPSGPSSRACREFMSRELEKKNRGHVGRGACAFWEMRLPCTTICINYKYHCFMRTMPKEKNRVKCSERGMKMYA